MGITPFAFVAGQPVTAASVKSRLDTVENFVNDGIVAADLQVAQWVDAGLVRGSEIGGAFVAAPVARMETQDIHVIVRANDWADGFVISDDPVQDDWVPVHGLYKTVRVFPPRTETTADVVFRCVFYTYEKAGTALSAAANEAARFGLYVDAAPHSSCTRRVFNEGPTPTPQGDEIRRVHSMEALLTGVSRGTHQIGVKCFMNYTGSTARTWKNVWVKASTIIIRPVYR